MGVRVIRRFCSNCGQERSFQKPAINHVFHGLVTLLTLGLWLGIWLAVTMASCVSAYRCSECGYPQRAAIWPQIFRNG